MTNRYHIEGALRESGRDSITVIDAETEEAATKIAMDRGILVSVVKKLPKPPPTMDLRFQAVGFVASVVNIAGIMFIIIGSFAVISALADVAGGTGLAKAEYVLSWYMVGASASVVVAGFVLCAFAGLIEVLRTIECNQRKLLSAKEAPP